MQAARDATDGLVATRDGLKDQLKPLLMAQGNDEYYVKSGLEFTAYENWQSAKGNLESANEVLEEVKEEKPMLEEEYADAKYELDRANNNDEYKERRAIFDDIKTRLDAMKSKEKTAQDAFDALDGDIENLKQAYDDAKKDREDYRQFVKDEADHEFDDYDPTEGPPSLPEEETPEVNGGDNNGGPPPATSGS